MRISSTFICTRAQTRPIILPWCGQMDERKRKSASKQALKGGQLFFLFSLSFDPRDVVASDPFFFLLNLFFFFSLFPPNNNTTITGKDATEDFEEIGHSVAANDMLAKYKIGTLKGGDGGKAARKQAASAVSTGAAGAGGQRRGQGATDSAAAAGRARGAVSAEAAGQVERERNREREGVCA